MQPQEPAEVWVDYAGHSYQVFIGENGRFYLHDPQHRLDFEHVALPTAVGRVTTQDGRLGASLPGALAQNLVPAALSFVPVVGPVLGPIASAIGSIVGSMFGGNDPTPISTLDQRVVSLREAIVQANLALGRPDKMPTLPAGRTYAHPYHCLPVLLELWPNNASIQDNNHWICDWSGVNCDGCGNMRKCFYAAINKLTPIANQLSAAANNATLEAQIVAQIRGTMGSGTGVAPGAQPSGPGSGVTAGQPGLIFGQPTPSGGGVTGGGAFNPGSPYYDPALQPPPSSSSFDSASVMGIPTQYLPFLLLGIPLVVGLLADHKEKTRVVYRERRHATKRR